MEIQEHYALNLKRRPEKLYAWIGAQWQMGFDFEKLTVFEAFDARQYKDLGDMLKKVGDYFFANQLNYTKSYGIMQDEYGAMGYIGNMISKLVMLLEVEKQEETSTWFMLWEDDVVLQRQYQALIDIQIPDDAALIAFHSPERFADYTQIERHQSLPFVRGTPVIKANQALAVNKQGASAILNIYRDQKPLYELEQFFQRHQNIRGAYTSTENFAHLIHMRDFYSDIIPAEKLEKHPSGIKWKKTSIEGITNNAE